MFSDHWSALQKRLSPCRSSRPWAPEGIWETEREHLCGNRVLGSGEHGWLPHKAHSPRDQWMERTESQTSLSTNLFIIRFWETHGSGNDLRADSITSIHIVLYRSASCNVAPLACFLGEAEQLLLRHSGFKRDDKVHRLPFAICENFINGQLEEDSKTAIRTYSLAYLS